MLYMFCSAESDSALFLSYVVSAELNPALFYNIKRGVLFCEYFRYGVLYMLCSAESDSVLYNM